MCNYSLMTRTIIIMAKVPRAGNVKTRLQPFLSAEQCRALAEAFLFDAINKTRNVCDRLIIAFAPAREKNYFAHLIGENLTLIEQSGADLGEKMSDAFEFVFGLNPDAKAVMIGTDSPTFPPHFIERAFEALKSTPQTVLGKSADGGFYLIGLNKIVPRLFDRIEWSSPLVFEQIKRNIEKSNVVELKLIPNWYDVDNPNDLVNLREELLKNEHARKIAPHTYQWLIANAEIFALNSNSFLISPPENKI